jgi:hypothetical protein
MGIKSVSNQSIVVTPEGFTRYGDGRLKDNCEEDSKCNNTLELTHKYPDQTSLVEESKQILEVDESKE